MAQNRIFKASFASVYPMYVAKAERKDRTKEEVDEIICWLTGYSQTELEEQLQKQVTFEQFFAEAPAPQSFSFFDYRCCLWCASRKHRG